MSDTLGFISSPHHVEYELTSWNSSWVSMLVSVSVRLIQNYLGRQMDHLNQVGLCAWL